MRFEQVWFRYGRRDQWTLSEVDATVAPGETVVVLGRNGAGKSTLLQLAAGVLRPVRGRVTDRPAVVGWVPERFPAEQPFTAEGYLRHLAAMRGGSGVDHWIERLMLTEHRFTRLGELSKGTAQKVGLAQALLVPPGLLILDEPWEGLDSVTRTLIPQIVAEVTNAGGSVLVSDHRGEIAELAGSASLRGDRLVTGDLRSEKPLGSASDFSGRKSPAAIAGLPGAVRWMVSEGRVRPEEREDLPAEVIIEVAVRKADADATVAALSASGHRVLGVREGQANR